MGMPSSLLAAENITFERAIELTQSLLAQMETDRLSEAEIEQAVASLVKTSNGARGFFVTYLTDDRPLADTPSSGVLDALRQAPDMVAELLVKNLAMSAAMVVHHSREQNEEMAASSARVQGRSRLLIQTLQLPACQSLAQQMLASVENGGGEYASFLSRWGYDGEQKVAISSAVKEAMDSESSK